MAQPSRVKYRKPHRTPYTGKAKGNKYVAFGEYGLMCIAGKGLNSRGQQKTGNWITEKQLESARVVVSKAVQKYIKVGGKMWCRVFPQLSITKKPLGVRMGSGKGNPEFFVAVVKQGTIIYEIAGVPKDEAKEALIKAGDKLNVKCKVIAKGEKGMYE